MKKIIAIVLGLLVLCCCLVCGLGFAFSKQLTDFASSNGINIQTTVDLDRSLREKSDAINKLLPIDVDESTRWETTKVNNGVLEYHYTILVEGVDSININTQTEIKARLVETIKNSSEMKWYRDNKISFHYVYTNLEGEEILRLKIDSVDYLL